MSTISLGVSSTTNVVTLVLEPQNTLSISTVGSVTPTSLLDLSDVNASSITDTQVLVYDAATQTFIPGDGGGSDTNIGNTDQTLTGVRDVEMDGNNLTFSQGDVVRHTITPNNGATFYRGVTVDGTDTTGGKVILSEGSNNGSNFIGLAAPASVDANVDFVLPGADGVEGQQLVTDGSGNLSFDYTESVYLAVYNNNGVTLSAGTPVYAKGVQGNDIIIGVADANDSSKMPAIGVLLEELADASSGEIITAGLFNKTISGLTGVSVGDTVYVSNAGTLTVTKPTASTDLIQNIGVVLQTNGTNIQKMKVSAIDRTNDIPNLASGTFFIGGATGQLSPYTLPIADGTANQFLKTDGAGAVTFTSITQATGNELENVVEDTTPQLGGVLDSNGSEIRFRGTGHTNYVAIAPSTVEPGSSVTFYPPIADGTTGQVIQTNGSGRLSFTTVTSATGNELENVVEDTTPQLGGNLDAQSNNITNLGSLNGTAASKIISRSLTVACSDETSDLTTGTAKATFRMPEAATITGVRASVTTAPAGSVLTVDINEAGTSILSTKLTIDAGEKTSTTAATAAVISDTSVADDAEMTVDIDGVGSSTAGAGLKVTIYYTPA
jgi:hypothetical protein